LSKRRQLSRESDGRKRLEYTHITVKEDNTVRYCLILIFGRTAQTILSKISMIMNREKN